MAKKKAAKKKTRTKKTSAKKSVETLTHADDKRSNIPTAELASVVRKQDKTPKKLRYPRNTDLDPQLVWKGKDEQDDADLVVNAPPLYIQEKVHPKVLVDDLLKQTEATRRVGEGQGQQQLDLFGNFNGVPEGDAKTEFYQHEANWTNRMILGDSLQVMASLAEREGLRGKVQCIYIDPPYGIKFNSNFQWSTTSRDVKDGKSDHITREPEQVKAFRDTWRDGIHSYLTYLRDRLTVARDLLSESGSIFVQIGDENVHRIRAVVDEVFGDENFVSVIAFKKTSSSSGNLLSAVNDFIIWYAKVKRSIKYRQPYLQKELGGAGGTQYKWGETATGERKSYGNFERLRAADEVVRILRPDNITSQRPAGGTDVRQFSFEGKTYTPGKGTFKTDERGLTKLAKARRLVGVGNTLSYVRYLDDFPVFPLSNSWEDTGTSGFGDPKVYVVQTLSRIVERCVLMTTDPGDLILDPTCGSGTSAFVGEQWGRRWITADTSRVALALARARLMGAKYAYYLLADSREGKAKEAEVTRSVPSESPTHGNIRHGFVYERVPHIMLSSITRNAEIDVIWEQFQEKLEPFRADLNKALKQEWEEWEIPREVEEDWSSGAKKLHAVWWQLRIERQQEIDASIAAKADFEYLYDRPYEDKSKVRVAGPFTVESLSPHRTLGVDENDNLIDETQKPDTEAADFAEIILENLKTSGVQQAAKEDRITFSAVTGWPGKYVCATGTYTETDADDAEEKTAGIFIGPEFGTVQKTDLTAAARECGDAEFDVLISCAFNYGPHCSDFNKLGAVNVLQARMNADLHMADELKNTGKGNLFVIFGEPDIGIFEGQSEALKKEIDRRSKVVKQQTTAVKKHNEELVKLKESLKKLKKVKKADDERRDEKVAECEDSIEATKQLIGSAEYQIRRYQEFQEYAPEIPESEMVVEIYGVDVFKPQTGDVVSDSTDGIACWFIDTDYNEESFFVRHAYFLGAGDPYKSLKTTLKAEIDPEAWDSLNSDTSRPFPKPKSGRIAVKVINHLGDEVMKVFRVE